MIYYLKLSYEVQRKIISVICQGAKYFLDAFLSNANAYPLVTFFEDFKFGVNYNGDH